MLFTRGLSDWCLSPYPSPWLWAYYKPPVCAASISRALRSFDVNFPVFLIHSMTPNIFPWNFPRTQIIERVLKPDLSSYNRLHLESFCTSFNRTDSSVFAIYPPMPSPSGNLIFFEKIQIFHLSKPPSTALLPWNSGGWPQSPQGWVFPPKDSIPC